MALFRGMAVAALSLLLVGCSIADESSSTGQSDTERPTTGVSTTPEDSAGVASSTPAPAVTDRTRGLMSLPAAVEALYEPSSQSDCSEPPIKTQEGFAFAVGKRAVFCTEAVTKLDGEQPWGGRFSVLTVDLPRGTSQSDALKVVGALLPSDATLVSQALGTNPDYAEVRGSCLRVHYVSPSLAEVVAASNPTWYRPAGATAILYTGKRLEGAAGAYARDSVDFLSIAVEGEAADPEGSGC